MDRIYVDKDCGKIERTDLYLVKLTLPDGTSYEELEPRKLFPFTNETKYITLLEKGEKELAIIRDIDDLDEISRKAIQECFKEYYMIPHIQKVLECYDKFGMLKWKVETDRGTVSFRIKNRHSDIKHLPGGHRIIIRDSNDNRYEIEDYTKLDSRSARLLFSYL